MSAYTLKDYAKATGMNARELAALRRATGRELYT